MCGGIGKVCANGFCCGDGHVDPGEQCDLGAANAPNAYGSGTCTTQCKTGGYCGDGIVNGPEACDSNGSGAVTLGACNPECTGFYTKKSINATSAFGSGNLGGPSGADTSCQTQFGAGWKALVVGGTRRATLTPFVGDGAQDWVLQKYTYYYNAQSQLIWRTDSVPLLGVSGGARQPLSASVYDASAFIYAWSGWQTDWTTVPDMPASALGTCIGWTSASSSDWGQFVTADLTPANDACATTYRILCVQQ
ncbi:MAG: DUF1554 domain-containing protein [Myxococcota bacterium]|nr:DUF1554 domain-containing protein [Myxococcota bacterium]